MQVIKAAEQKWLPQMLELSPSPQFVVDVFTTAVASGLLSATEWLSKYFNGTKPLSAKSATAKFFMGFVENELNKKERADAEMKMQVCADFFAPSLAHGR